MTSKVILAQPTIWMHPGPAAKDSCDSTSIGKVEKVIFDLHSQLDHLVYCLILALDCHWLTSYIVVAVPRLLGLPTALERCCEVEKSLTLCGAKGCGQWQQLKNVKSMSDISIKTWHVNDNNTILAWTNQEQMSMTQSLSVSFQKNLNYLPAQRIHNYVNGFVSLLGVVGNMLFIYMIHLSMSSEI